MPIGYCFRLLYVTAQVRDVVLCHNVTMLLDGYMIIDALSLPCIMKNCSYASESALNWWCMITRFINGGLYFGLPLYI